LGDWRCSRWWLRRKFLASGRRRILRRQILRPFIVVARVVANVFKLHLELALAFLSRFEVAPLLLEPCFLFLGFALSGLLAALFLLLGNLALLDLLFESAEAGGCLFLLPREVLFLALSFVPVSIVRNNLQEANKGCAYSMARVSRS
jgi:hypothetical protein